MTNPDAPAAPPELTRPFAASRIGHGADILVEATPAECAALAKRMGIPAIHSLSCQFHLLPAGGAAIRATGSLHARVSQICTVSLDPFDQEVAEEFSVCFVPAGTESEDLDLDADDEIGYANGTLDLGDAAAEQLALALDPFPRKPGVTLPDVSENAAGHPFAALAGRRRN